MAATLSRHCSPWDAADADRSEPFARWVRRVRALNQRPIRYIGNAAFGPTTDPMVQDYRFDHDPVLTDADEHTCELPANLPAHLARLCDAGLLSADAERALFRRMNWLKFRAAALRQRLCPQQPHPELADQIEDLLQEARVVRDRILRANIRLVISVIKRFVGPQHAFDDLLSDGIVALMHAAEKFDYDRGFRFSTYAYRAIARNAWRAIMLRKREMDRYGSDDIHGAADVGTSALLSEAEWVRLRRQLSRMMARLDRRERFILRGRFALGNHHRVRTFQDLADKLGISKERVRQLEQRAVEKLRAMAVLQADD